MNLTKTLYKTVIFHPSSHTLSKKLNNFLQESKKLNVSTGINAVINFYNISITLVCNIIFPPFSF